MPRLHLAWLLPRQDARELLRRRCMWSADARSIRGLASCGEAYKITRRIGISLVQPIHTRQQKHHTAACCTHPNFSPRGVCSFCTQRFHLRVGDWLVYCPRRRRRHGRSRERLLCNWLSALGEVCLSPRARDSCRPGCACAKRGCGWTRVTECLASPPLNSWSDSRRGR